MPTSNLLKKFDSSVLPEEFLAARLLGKKGGLFRNWDFLISGENKIELLNGTIFYPFLIKSSGEGIWRFLRHEYEWVYRRMNGRLRRIFEPYFVYREIDSLVLAVRYIYHEQTNEVIARQLQNSLLDKDIQKVLTSGRKLPAVLDKLASCFLEKAGILHGLQAHYAEYGIHRLEAYLRQEVLSYVLRRCRSPLLKEFFRYVIDFHNCMTLAKNIRWEIADAPIYLRGGTIAGEKFTRVYLKKDPAAVLRIFPIRSYKEDVSSITELEKTLLAMLTSVLRRWANRRTPVGDILFYLWEQYRYTRNISLVLGTMHLNDAPVRESLVL